MSISNIDKIREEVERLKSNIIHGACSSQIAMETRCKEEAYDEVLSILDSLQEESVSIWHDASEQPNIKEKGGIFVITSLNGEYIGSRYYNHNDVTITFGNYDKWVYLNDLLNLSNVERTVKNWEEMPVSEDLEEAAKKYYPILRDDKGDYLRDAFKAGAQWQKEQMVKNVVLETKVYLESDGDGIESEHQEWLALENNEILDIPNNIGLKDGDKVKVIIIKEEESV